MRKVYLIPNFVTTGNMFCGFYSMVSAIQHDFVTASWAIMAASIFDMLDGRIARLAKATSQFGVEYDSLSDLTSFGVAPAVLVYLWALAPFGRMGWLAAFLFMACGALRLARFNVNSGKIPGNFFQGLPIPMAAGGVATFIIFCNAVGWSEIRVTMLALTLGLAGLMVSTVKFPSFKELNWRSRASFGYLMIGVLAMIVVAARPEITLFLVLATYIVLGLAWNVAVLLRILPAPAQAGPYSAAEPADLDHDRRG